MASDRLGVAVLLLLALVAFTGRAGAVEGAPARDDAKPRANALLAEARQLYDRGEYGGALERLNAAYAAFPSPLIHFNYGQVYRGLLRDVEALDAFEHFLAEGKDQDPTLRHEAEIYLVELYHRVGTVEIIASADGAGVAIDGKRVGTTPLKHGLRVMPGPHQILVQGTGDAIPFLRQVEIAPGETTRVDAKMEKRAVAADPVCPAAPPSPPIYKRWWFWTGVGAVVVGTVVAALAIANSKEKCDMETYNAGCITF